MAPKDDAEVARLDRQHEYITKGLGFRTHPTIFDDLVDGEDVRIATVFHRLQPDGFDFSDLPINPYSPPVHFDFEDIKSRDGALDHHRGQYHLVVVRILHTSIPTEAWETVVKNLIALLRPGCWLQWTDWDPLTPRIAAINPAASDVALRDVLIRYVDCLKAKKVGTTYRISTSMRSLGLEEDDSDMYPLNPEVEFTKNILTGVINFLHESESLSEAETEEVRGKVSEEIEVGKPLLWYDLWCHIGRKPL